MLAVLASEDQWTPKPGDPRLAHVHHHIIASNALAIAAGGKATLGFETNAHVAKPLSGEAWQAAERFCRQAVDLPAGSLLIGGGETTVTLGEQPGLGGRNQEFALAAARWIMAHDAPLTVLAAGTDGNDGPTDAAGGLVDGGTWQRALDSGGDPHRALAQHDAYSALLAAGDLLITGPTNTNVMDLALAWRH